MKALMSLLISYFFVVSTSAICLADTNASLLRVVDGDTIKVRYLGQSERVRLIGIDTPEKEINDKAQRDSKRTNKDVHSIISQGKRAAEFTSSLVRSGDPLRLEFDTQQRDPYGRLLAYVYSKSGFMLNERILSEGYANLLTISPNVRYAKRFQTAYQTAVKSHKGLWAGSSQ